MISDKREVGSKRNYLSHLTSHQSLQFSDGSSGAAASSLYQGPSPRMLSNQRFGKRSGLCTDRLGSCGSHAFYSISASRSRTSPPAYPTTAQLELGLRP